MEVAIDGVPGRELARKQPPLAASAQQIEDRVQDDTKLGRAWPSTRPAVAARAVRAASTLLSIRDESLDAAFEPRLR